MEETMSASLDPVTVALAQSDTEGEEFVPADLLAVLSADPNPTAVSYDDIDRSNAHFTPVERDFGFLRILRVRRQAPSPEQQERLVALMRWLRRQFSDWNSTSDSKAHVLAAMFLLTAYLDQGGFFWSSFAAKVTVNAEIVAVLSRRLEGLQFTPGPSDRSRFPISDKTILDRFNAADHDADWVTVASEWPKFGFHLFPDAFTSQSASYLRKFAMNELTLAMGRHKRTGPVMLVLLSLPVAECFELGISSTNPYVRFGSILRLFQQQRGRNEPMSQSEETLLTQLLLSVANDESEWRQWMLSFNRYPLRHPQIQNALGQALALAPDTVIEPYISAIQLSSAAANRDAVAACLRSFRSAASLERRKMLWNLAHERWQKWEFGRAEREAQYLSKIGTCDLDYAIVGYAVECMSPRQCEDKCTALVTELNAINEKWNASEVDFLGEANAILTAFQPYAYARQMADDGDWLIAKDRYFFPFDPGTDPYNAMYFSIGRWLPLTRMSISTT